MHTLSSARRTCMASASAVECTATVEMPSSLHARRTRSAISPGLAIRILSNDHERGAELDRLAVLDENLRHRARARRWDLVHRLHRFDDQKRLSGRHLGADIDERLGAGLRWPVGGRDMWRG